MVSKNHLFGASLSVPGKCLGMARTKILICFPPEQKIEQKEWAGPPVIDHVDGLAALHVLGGLCHCCSLFE